MDIFPLPVVKVLRAFLPIPVLSSPEVNTANTSLPIPTFPVAPSRVPCGGAAPSGDMRILSVKSVMLLITSVKPLRAEAPPTAEPATVREPGIFTTPALVPVIHETPPSPDEMSNWLSPVALAASPPPIITLKSPVVILSPE